MTTTETPVLSPSPHLSISAGACAHGCLPAVACTPAHALAHVCSESYVMQAHILCSTSLLRSPPCARRYRWRAQPPLLPLPPSLSLFLSTLRASVWALLALAVLGSRQEDLMFLDDAFHPLHLLRQLLALDRGYLIHWQDR
jgi:hypothetical protein